MRLGQDEIQTIKWSISNIWSQSYNQHHLNQSAQLEVKLVLDRNTEWVIEQWLLVSYPSNFLVISVNQVTRLMGFQFVVVYFSNQPTTISFLLVITQTALTLHHAVANHMHMTLFDPIRSSTLLPPSWLWMSKKKLSCTLLHTRTHS